MAKLVNALIHLSLIVAILEKKPKEIQKFQHLNSSMALRLVKSQKMCLKYFKTLTRQAIPILTTAFTQQRPNVTNPTSLQMQPYRTMRNRCPQTTSAGLDMANAFTHNFQDARKKVPHPTSKSSAAYSCQRDRSVSEMTASQFTMMTSCLKRWCRLPLLRRRITSHTLI